MLYYLIPTGRNPWALPRPLLDLSADDGKLQCAATATEGLYWLTQPEWAIG